MVAIWVNKHLYLESDPTDYDNGCFARKQRPEMSLPSEYLAALAPLADAFSAYEKATGRLAVLVGGAAAAIHTDGAFMSADFDVVAGNDTAFDQAMAAAGFVDDEKALHGQGGWYHPAHPQFAVEQVSGSYFDGRGDKARCLKLMVREDAAIVLPAVEDMIADRLGQHEVAGGDMSMLEQARALYALAEGLDLAYLYRRIVEESGNPAHLGLSGAS
ncbi:Nucleotidyltransferase family protein [Novosphingobium lubricantis]|jgi:hypothetical protein